LECQCGFQIAIYESLLDSRLDTIYPLRAIVDPVLSISCQTIWKLTPGPGAAKSKPSLGLLSLCNPTRASKLHVIAIPCCPLDGKRIVVEALPNEVAVKPLAFGLLTTPLPALQDAIPRQQ
jgi:hypothetical protein